MSTLTPPAPCLMSKVEAFRRCLGLFFIYYWSRFVFDIDLYFFNHLPRFGLFQFDFVFQVRHWVFASLFVFSMLFIAGKLNRQLLILFLTFILNFYLQNPYLLHEAQPMAFFMLLSFLFLPLNRKEPLNPLYPKLLLLFLGIYYFFAAYKKLPDPQWPNGMAIWHLLQWEVVAMIPTVSRWLISHLPVEFFQLITYSILAFEFSFLFLIFTPFKKHLVWFGMTMHLMISLFLDIGTLGQLMIVWYALL